MSAIITFFVYLFSILGGSLAGSATVTPDTFTTPDFSSSDAAIKTDINTIHQELEVYFTEYGHYPSEDFLELSGDEILKGIDTSNLNDPDGKKINTEGSRYTYTGIDCTSLRCQKYELSATLNDLTTYDKKSLN